MSTPRVAARRRRPATPKTAPRPAPTQPQAEATETHRRRIVGAALDTVAELGYAGLNVAQIIRHARVSRRTFYSAFTDCDSCFLAVCEKSLNRVRPLARHAYDRQRDWRRGMRAAVAELLTLMDEQPALARLWLVETHAAGDPARRLRAHVMSELAAVIDQGRVSRSPTYDPPPEAAEYVLGGVLEIITGRLIADRHEPHLTDLYGPIMSMIMLPYRGTKVGAAELEGPGLARVPGAARRQRDGNPLAGLKMRITYRTVRVLSTIADNPGANSATIADIAGIRDEGQGSRLLRRLEGLGLIQHRGDDPTGRGTKAWHLTERGYELERAMRPTVALA